MLGQVVDEGGENAFRGQGLGDLEHGQSVFAYAGKLALEGGDEVEPEVGGIVVLIAIGMSMYYSMTGTYMD